MVKYEPSIKQKLGEFTKKERSDTTQALPEKGLTVGWVVALMCRERKRWHKFSVGHCLLGGGWLDCAILAQASTTKEFS